METATDTLTLSDLKGIFDSFAYVFLFIGLLVVVYIFMRVQQRRRTDRLHHRRRQRRLLR